MTDAPKPFPALLAELQAAHKASLGHDTKAAMTWVKLVDRNIGRVFEEITQLQKAIELAGTANAELASRGNELAQKLEETELREKNHFQTQIKLVHERDEKIKGLELALKSVVAKTNKEMEEVTLKNFAMAKRLQEFLPGQMRIGIIGDKNGSVPFKPATPRPPLMKPALEEKFGIFADLALIGTRPNLLKP